MLLWEPVDKKNAVGWLYAGEPCTLLRLGRVSGVVRAVDVEANGVKIIHIGDFKTAFESAGQGVEVA